MKTIQPIDVWVDGEVKQATQLTLTITYDNLETQAVFAYHLSDSDNNSFIQGTFPVEGDAYQQWGASLDANADAYNLAAAQLNLMLI